MGLLQEYLICSLYAHVHTLLKNKNEGMGELQGNLISW